MPGKEEGIMTCDWCDEPAVCRDSRPGEDRLVACEDHRRELARSIESEVFTGGNPFAGEAAEGFVEDL